MANEMRITPLEIRQKNFEKKLRGYDKDEVSAFLLSLSNEWERVIDENKEYKIKLEQTEKEVQKLREVENSLFKTLKTAEDTGANLIDQANKAAELHLKESHMNAEAILNEAKGKAKSIIEDAELKAKELIVEMQEAIKDLEENYRTIENQRDNMVMELKNIANDVLERIQRPSKAGSADFKMEDHLVKVKKLVRESEDLINNEQLTVRSRKLSQIPKASDNDEDTKAKLEAYIRAHSKRRAQAESKTSSTKQQPKRKPKPSDADLSGKGSFFDEIED
jgi:cell division initiation protein